MAKEELTQEMLDKANDIVMKLAKVFFEEGDKSYSTRLMLFVLARFTAGVLLSIQEHTNQFDIATEYTNIVKRMMADMGRDMNIQSIKNQIKENEEELSKMNLREEDILRMMFDNEDKKGS